MKSAYPEAGIRGGRETLPCGSTILSIPAVLEVREQAANDVCVVMPTKKPQKKAPSGSFFGQVLLSIKFNRPDGPKIYNVSHVVVFSNTTMGYRSGANCNANLPKYHLPVDAVIFNL